MSVHQLEQELILHVRIHADTWQKWTIVGIAGVIAQLFQQGPWTRGFLSDLSSSNADNISHICAQEKQRSSAIILAMMSKLHAIRL